MSVKKIFIIISILFASQNVLAAVANNSITSAKIKNGTIIASDIKRETIQGAQIKNNTLTGVDIKNSSLTGPDIKNSSLTGVDIKNGSLTGADIKDGSLTDKDLKDDAITSKKLREEAVELSHLSEEVRGIFETGVSGSVIDLSFPAAYAETAVAAYCPEYMGAVAASCSCYNNNDGVEVNFGVMVQCSFNAYSAFAYCAADSFLYDSYLPLPTASVMATCVSIDNVSLDGETISTESGTDAMSVGSLSSTDEESGLQTKRADDVRKTEEKRLGILQQEQLRLDRILAR